MVFEGIEHFCVFHIMPALDTALEEFKEENEGVCWHRQADVSLGKQGKNQPVCYKIMFLIHTVKYEKAFSLIDFF